jgi:hypothetical protein
MNANTSADSTDKKHETVVAETCEWLLRAVIGLNLCPFAKAVQVKDKIRYAVSDAKDAEQLCEDLYRALQHLHQIDAEQVETTLLIHPYVLHDFLDYNDFLAVADAVIEDMDLAGEIQIASFHPHYQFAGTSADAVENYTNRSPYPMLQLLRESSIESAIDSYPDAAGIYERNIETLRTMGMNGLESLGVFAAGEEKIARRKSKR